MSDRQSLLGSHQQSWWFNEINYRRIQVERFIKVKPRFLQSGDRRLSLEHPLLVGVLNVTPDSFSDGGKFADPQSALLHARQMIEMGADWIDIGGESSGPGSQAVSLEVELQRTLPIIRALRRESDIWISVDTYKAETARQAIAAGANAINDVTALRGDPEMIKTVAESRVPLVITYSKDPNARTTKTLTTYLNVVKTVETFFQSRLSWLRSEGIPLQNVILDPGMGYFVSGHSRYSFEILRRLPELVRWGFPIMVSASRKSFLAEVSPGQFLTPQQREVPTLVATSIAIWQGASLLRLHDVQHGRLVLDTLRKLQE